MVCVALVGYRACGKTTVGRVVAEKIGYRFVDLDACIEAQLKQSIHSFFTAHGEAAFRDVEQAVLAQTLEMSENIVLSTGGGCILREENRVKMRDKCSKIIYLEVSISEIQNRLTHNDGDRPSLTGQSVVNEVPAILSVREPLYKAVADYVVNANVPISAVVEAVLPIVENLDEKSPA